jgi:hypothetical protein
VFDADFLRTFPQPLERHQITPINTQIITYFVLFVIAVFLVVGWIAFPFIVLSKFNEWLKVARQMADQAEQAAAALKNLKSAHNETNKALQYLVDRAAVPRASSAPEID